MALRLVQSNGLVVCEDLNVRGMVRNHRLAKSITDAGWATFKRWRGYFGDKYGKLVIAVPPHNTSQNCSNCDQRVEKSLSTRTHVCPHCRYTDFRDRNAALNILPKGLSMVGRTKSQASEICPLVWLEKSC
ncbi:MULTISPECIES: RNA-guided endonuclease TnpB family protein [Limnospira]|uniref:Transposase n=1 Tax=Limnospira fusiformis PMC 851.14 TaxID=2219512 RepID=A0ABU9ELG6_LIMFS|nr:MULTISPECIES: RNA-guided endonuclease TnpB family protein [Limnospira]MDY7052648.1 transposase [Limnospira fusiformis LS22]